MQDGGALCNSCSRRADAVDSEVKNKQGRRVRRAGEEERGREGRIKRGSVEDGDGDSCSTIVVIKKKKQAHKANGRWMMGAYVSVWQQWGSVSLQLSYLVFGCSHTVLLL